MTRSPDEAQAREARADEVEDLRRRLHEAEETLRAIRQGEVDSLVVDGPEGMRVYSLRSVEQPYRMLVEQMQDGAATLTRDGEVLYANRRFAELAGTPLETIVGGPVARFFGPEDLAVLHGMIRAGSGKHEGALRTAGGTVIPVYVSLSTFTTDGVESLCLVVSDLSELASTRAARARAEAASRAKDEFVATLGHELRNPLNAIAAAVPMLGEAGTSTSQARAREVIARQAAYLTRIVGDLVDISRVTTGKIALVSEVVDLDEVVTRSFQTLYSVGAFEGRGASVEVAPVAVQGDRTRLEQILMNLLSNAAKFTPAGGAVKVTLHPEGGEAVLRVADTGVGMPAELLPHIFDVFVQGERGIDRSTGGLGLGLTLVQRFVMLHGGQVEAHSDGPGRGSTFTVRLPAYDGAAAADPVRSAPASQGRRRIVVVEDNEDGREMLRLLLESAGHEVHTAADGPDGVELVTRVRPDIAFVDLGLPELNGFEVARRIRAAPGTGDVHLIALTGYGQAEDRAHALEAGFDDHLVKPVDPARLPDVLARRRRQTPPPPRSPSR